MSINTTDCSKITEELKKTHDLEIEELKKTHNLEIEELKRQIDNLNSINSNFSLEEEILKKDIRNINKNSKKLVKKYKSSSMSNREKLKCIMKKIKDIMIHNEKKVISDMTTKILERNIKRYLDGTSCSKLYSKNNRRRKLQRKRSKYRYNGLNNRYISDSEYNGYNGYNGYNDYLSSNNGYISYND